MAQLYAGTSGFAYPSWKPGFYPPGVPAKGFLRHYAGRLNAVEINYTFRRLPAVATLASWVEATPEGFVIALKAPMRITHVMRLAGASEATALFLRVIDPLRSARRLGPVLFQLPPQMPRNPDLLARFLDELPGELRYSFEFRHSSWLEDGVYRLLESHNVALCVAESEKLVVPDVVTADFAYYRLRKPGYTPEELASIAARARGLTGEGRNVFLMFKHEETPQGALDAETVLDLARS